MKWLETAAQAGDPNAALRIAELLLERQVDAAGRSKAVQFLQIAAVGSRHQRHGQRPAATCGAAGRAVVRTTWAWATATISSNAKGPADWRALPVSSQACWSEATAAGA